MTRDGTGSATAATKSAGRTVEQRVYVLVDDPLDARLQRGDPPDRERTRDLTP
jgi:hypothetical protein